VITACGVGFLSHSYLRFLYSYTKSLIPIKRRGNEIAPLPKLYYCHAWPYATFLYLMEWKYDTQLSCLSPRKENATSFLLCSLKHMICNFPFYYVHASIYFPFFIIDWINIEHIHPFLHILKCFLVSWYICSFGPGRPKIPRDYTFGCQRCI